MAKAKKEKEPTTEEEMAQAETAVEEQQTQEPEETLSAEVAEAKDKYLRLYSEFENFRRRNAKERLELVKTASSDLIEQLLPVLDDFERAREANQSQEDPQAIKEGFDLIHNKLFKSLEAKGLKVMDTAKGTDFDTEMHEAVTRFPVEEEPLKGKIIDTAEKGYYLADKVIRFAKVVIGA